MPSPSNITVLIQVNAEEPVAGGVTTEIGDVLTFTPGGDTTGAGSYLWRIIAHEPGASLPSGWTAEEGDTYVWTSTDEEPDPITLSEWGKGIVELTVNGGERDGQPAADLVNSRSGWNTLNTDGREDIAPFEDTQFHEGGNAYAAVYQANNRIEASAGVGSAASTSQTIAGTSTTVFVTPNSLAALWEAGADNTGGATITMGEGGSFNLITSTTAITAFAFTTDKAGREATIRFNTVRTLTHNATSLILPSGANITTAAGDYARVLSLGGGNFAVISYTRANGTPLVSSDGSADGIQDFYWIPSYAGSAPNASASLVTVMALAAATPGSIRIHWFRATTGDFAPTDQVYDGDHRMEIIIHAPRGSTLTVGNSTKFDGFTRISGDDLTIAAASAATHTYVFGYTGGDSDAASAGPPFEWDTESSLSGGSRKLLSLGKTPALADGTLIKWRMKRGGFGNDQIVVNTAHLLDYHGGGITSGAIIKSDSGATWAFYLSHGSRPGSFGNNASNNLAVWTWVPTELTNHPDRISTYLYRAHLSATANISSMSGLGVTVDGVLASSPGTTVFAGQQTTVADRGIYMIPNSGAWVRVGTFPVGRAVAGNLLSVVSGTANGGKLFRFSDAEGSDVVGTHNLTVTQVGDNSYTPGGNEFLYVPGATTFAPVYGTFLEAYTAWKAFEDSGGVGRLVVVINGTTISFEDQAYVSDARVSELIFEPASTLVANSTGVTIALGASTVFKNFRPRFPRARTRGTPVVNFTASAAGPNGCVFLFDETEAVSTSPASSSIANMPGATGHAEVTGAGARVLYKIETADATETTDAHFVADGGLVVDDNTLTVVTLDLHLWAGEVYLAAGAGTGIVSDADDERTLTVTPLHGPFTLTGDYQQFAIEGDGTWITVTVDAPNHILTDVQEITATGVYNAPSWASQTTPARVQIFGSTSGGGGGARADASGTAICGGGGSGGPQYEEFWTTVSEIDGVTATIGAAGTGGAGGTGSGNQSGANGGAGGTTTFAGRTVYTSGAGAGGAVGTAAGGGAGAGLDGAGTSAAGSTSGTSVLGGAAGGGSSGTWVTYGEMSGGGSGSYTTGFTEPGGRSRIGSGSGGGGAINAAGTAFVGQDGGRLLDWAVSAGGSATGAAGSDGYRDVEPGASGAGGGGANTSGVGGAGGIGGGGGGAAIGANGGAGGVGFTGKVRVTVGVQR